MKVRYLSNSEESNILSNLEYEVTLKDRAYL